MKDSAGSGSDVNRLVGADRVLAVLIELAAHPRGVTLDQLTSTLQSPKPTVHRALAALRKADLARQSARGTYVLGDEFMRLAFENFAQRPDTVRIGPVLEKLADAYGETAHYAVLSGKEVVYRAKTDPSRGAVRLTSVVGGRNPAHCTAVGKMLLSETVASRDDLVDLLGSGPFERRTARTICDVDHLWEELQATRSRGYGVDDQESEEGVNCVAVPVNIPGPRAAVGAISVSALTFRMPLDDLISEVPAIAAAVFEAA